MVSLLPCTGHSACQPIGCAQLATAPGQFMGLRPNSAFSTWKENMFSLQPGRVCCICKPGKLPAMQNFKTRLQQVQARPCAHTGSGQHGRRSSRGQSCRCWGSSPPHSQTAAAERWRRKREAGLWQSPCWLAALMPCRFGALFPEMTAVDFHCCFAASLTSQYFSRMNSTMAL